MLTISTQREKKPKEEKKEHYSRSIFFLFEIIVLAHIGNPLNEQRDIEFDQNHFIHHVKQSDHSQHFV